jgi:thiol:disulfide interchange protein DsbD
MRRVYEGARPQRGGWHSLVTLLVLLFGSHSLSYAGEHWQHDFAAAQREAASQKKPLLLGVTATWCGACRQMQQLTLTDARVTRQLQSSCVGVLVDADQHAGLLSEFKVEAFPTTILLDAAGNVQRRWVGYQPVAEFAAELERLTGGASNANASETFAAVSAIFPSNASTCAFSGYCLVSLLEDNKLRRGQPEVTADYNGQTLCFASADHKNRFLRNPQRYWPVANGTCVVTTFEDRSYQQGDPRVGVRWRGKLWFFADRERQQKFLRSPDRFIRDRSS